jgi:hypothetical protein
MVRVMASTGGADHLQFNQAEFTGRTCTFCKSPIGDTYYQIQGRDACPTCAQGRLASQNSSDSGGKMLKAFLWGGGAAVLGSAAFAIVALIGFQLAILSIGIGWLVGVAIKKGTDGHTSRKYQIMAVLLTYMAIATSYIPLIVAELAKKHPAAEKSAVPDATPVSRAEPVSASAAGVAMVILVGTVIALPLLDAFSSMPGGLLTLLIIFFGLQQAWKQTAPDVALVAGPYQNAP